MNFEGHKRASIENVTPQLDGGHIPIKRVIDEIVEVQADIFGDGHDKVDAVLLHRPKISKGKPEKWRESRMNYVENDCWKASFSTNVMGEHEYTIEAWIDHFSTWQYGLKKKFEDNQSLKTELLIGVEMMENALSRANSGDKKKLKSWISTLKKDENEREAVELSLSDDVSKVMYSHRDRSKAHQYHKILPVWIQRKKALFSAWYEFFPRSASSEHNKHGTFKDCLNVLPEVAKMGFDVVYFPPIHPIGVNHRKGLNNATTAKDGDPGSPWAIGGIEGGHRAIHPELGTMKDFKEVVKKAEELGMEIALDFAIQCSQDHPYVKDHPKWFKWRPDGTVQYAENPPKKYQDVLPVNFENDDWENLWKELKSVVEFWIEKGVRIFRVDNPHTKSFVFWEWLIQEINAEHEGIIFLAEAFTRPRVMEKLAKVGFTQSYTYFTWRNTKSEFEKYLTELTKTDLREYFRPNFWPNTPDILPVSLENKGESSFIIRLILAATMSSNYGIYGPLFEFGINDAYPGKEEYNHSEKYEFKRWDWQRQTKIKDVITRINNIRNSNPAFQSTWNIEFADCDNDNIICFTKIDKASQNKLLVIISLDPDFSQSGWIKVPVQKLKLNNPSSFVVEDLLTGSNYTWENEWNYVALHPQGIPAHIFRIEPA